ncbi:peptidase inhibitor family I36 protein [Streptomyces sp. NPDC094147]|uniref:peptidase inhibitor family I36 protein n=1 Tax=Streptomyces sp. NPDC094147 TaxID=3366057 RepID=UPI003827CE9D
MFGVVCTWTGPDGEGGLRLLNHDEFFLPGGVRSAQNQDREPWCFYTGPAFSGPRLQLNPRETNRDLAFPARSARRGFCEE